MTMYFSLPGEFLNILKVMKLDSNQFLYSLLEIIEYMHLKFFKYYVNKYCTYI